MTPLQYALAGTIPGFAAGVVAAVLYLWRHEKPRRAVPAPRLRTAHSTTRKA